MRLMGHKGKVTVEPLKEAGAVDLGAELLGEVVVFSIGVAVLYAEYRRQKRGEAREEDKQLDSFRMLQAKVDELCVSVEKQSLQIDKLNEMIKNVGKK